MQDIVYNSKNYDTDLEAAIIGAALNSPKAIGEFGLIQSKHFLNPNYAGYWLAIRELWESNRTSDIISVKAMCKQRGYPYDAVELTQISSVSPQRLLAYNEGGTVQSIFMEMWQRREVERIGVELQKGETGVNELLQRLEELHVGTDNTKLETASEIMLDTVNSIEENLTAYRKNEPLPNSVESGILKIDKLGGFRGGDLVVLAGRPGMGKSTVSRFIARHVANEYPVLLGTKEMSKQQINELFVAMEARVDSMKIRQGAINDGEHNAILRAAGEVAALPITYCNITDLSTLTFQIKKWRMGTDSSKIGLVVVDYVQQVNNQKKGGNREQEVGEVTERLKELANELNLVVIAVAQLSRAVEQRGGDKRPIPSDLRESGRLEQDATHIIFCYRPEYYGFMVDENGASNEGKLELILSKNRYGITGIAGVYIDLSTGTIFDSKF